MITLSNIWESLFKLLASQMNQGWLMLIRFFTNSFRLVFLLLELPSLRSLRFSLFLKKAYVFSRNSMNIFKMTSEITALGKSL